MRIPEWEIRDAICWKPELLGMGKLKLKGFQVPLKERKFIDILFKKGGKFLIVELKKDVITKSAVKQVLNYKKIFSKEKDLDPDKTVPVVAAPEITEEAKELCGKKGVAFKPVDLDKIHNVRPGKILYKKELGRKLKNISDKNPLCAHELMGEKSEFIDTMTPLNEKESFFWLYYSILDGGGPAQTFIRGFRELHRRGLDNPIEICRMAGRRGEDYTCEEILSSIENRAVLFNPGYFGNITYARGIVEASRLLEKYGFRFSEMYKKAKESGDVLGFLVKELSTITFMKSKYSRRKKQFLRGMALRAGWDLPTDGPWFLEGPNQSTHIMNVVRRMGIAWKDMNKKINEFCDEYLKDRAVLSHALWVIGKKNCLTNSKPRCENCLRDVCSSADSFGPSNL